MALNVWTQPSGYNFGTFYGEASIEIALPVQNVTGVTFEVISGSLPSGVFLVYRNSAWKLYGSPFVRKNRLNYSLKADNYKDRLSYHSWPKNVQI